MIKKLLKILFVSACAILPFNTSSITKEVSAKEHTYSTMQHYVYRFEKPFSSDLNTMEAWIKAPSYSEGGTITGNYMFNIGTTNDTTTSFGVDVTGDLKLVWGCKDVSYIFPNTKVNDGLYHQVAFTRNKEDNTFRVYIDGELKGEYSKKVPDANVPMAYCIGSDYKNWTCTAEPFNGQIEEISYYSSCLTGQEVKDNYQAGGGVNEAKKDSCMANLYLGKTWNQQIVNSNVGNTRVFLASQDKYVPVAPIEEYDYTILGLPDIQTMVDFPQVNWESTNVYLPMMQWVSEHIESDKIKFAIQVGDLVDDGSDDYQFSKAKRGFDLWDGKLPYSTVPGNHDYTYNCLKATDKSGNEIPSTRKLELYNEYFGVDYASEFEEFGGTYEENAIENSYYLFEVGEIKYLVINLEFFPRMSVIRWAGRLCEEFPDRRVIVNTHVYTDYYGRIAGKDTAWGPANYSYFSKANECTFGEDLWEGLISKYNNIFMTLSGHFSVEDAIVTSSTGINGNKIINVLIDEQCSNHWYGGRTYTTSPIDTIMLMKFNESKKEIYFRYYSTEKNAVYNLQNQFTLSFDYWQEPLEADYTN